MVLPTVFVTNRQRKIRFDLQRLRKAAERALPICLEAGSDPEAPLRTLEEVDVSVVSDRVIAGIHLKFMNISGPTDVITFHHGEIIISAETAASQGANYGQSLESELALYLIHGLLHLNGFDDLEKSDAAMMKVTQERILAEVLGN